MFTCSMSFENINWLQRKGTTLVLGNLNVSFLFYKQLLDVNWT